MVPIIHLISTKLKCKNRKNTKYLEPVGEVCTISIFYDHQNTLDFAMGPKSTPKPASLYPIVGRLPS
jgi:hypothetical protein